MKGVGGGSKKIGRNKDTCTKYRLTQRREKNKISKWKKLIKNLPGDNAMRVELEKKIRALGSKIIWWNILKSKLYLREMKTSK